MFHEKHLRSIYKSTTWMIIAFIITATVVYLMSGSWKEAMADALIIQAIKFFFFYWHERIWNRTNFGQELRGGKKLADATQASK